MTSTIEHKEPAYTWLNWLITLPPCFWTIALYVVDIARFIVCSVFLVFLVKHWRPCWLKPLKFTPLQQKLLLAFLFSYIKETKANLDELLQEGTIAKYKKIGK